MTEPQLKVREALEHIPGVISRYYQGTLPAGWLFKHNRPRLDRLIKAYPGRAGISLLTVVVEEYYQEKPERAVKLTETGAYGLLLSCRAIDRTLNAGRLEKYLLTADDSDDFTVGGKPVMSYQNVSPEWDGGPDGLGERFYDPYAPDLLDQVNNQFVTVRKVRDPESIEKWRKRRRAQAINAIEILLTQLEAWELLADRNRDAYARWLDRQPVSIEEMAKARENLQALVNGLLAMNVTLG